MVRQLRVLVQIKLSLVARLHRQHCVATLIDYELHEVRLGARLRVDGRTLLRAQAAIKNERREGVDVLTMTQVLVLLLFAIHRTHSATIAERDSG